MRIKNLIKKNIYLIIFLVIALLFVIAYFKSTEGFQEGYYYVGDNFRGCNFNYCTGNYEVVTKNRVEMCLKKCSAIYPNTVTATSDPTICKRTQGKTISTFSRNITIHKKMNIQGNNACEFQCPSGYTNINGICTKNPTRKTIITENCHGFTVNSIPNSHINPCISCGPHVYPRANVLPGKRVSTFYPIPKNEEGNATFKCEIPMSNIRSAT